MASELSIALPWGQRLFGKCSDLPGAFEKCVSAQPAPTAAQTPGNSVQTPPKAPAKVGVPVQPSNPPTAQSPAKVLQPPTQVPTTTGVPALPNPSRAPSAPMNVGQAPPQVS